MARKSLSTCTKHHSYIKSTTKLHNYVRDDNCSQYSVSNLLEEKNFQSDLHGMGFFPIHTRNSNIFPFYKKGVFTINPTTLLSLHIVLHDEVNDKSQTYSH